MHSESHAASRYAHVALAAAAIAIVAAAISAGPPTVRKVRSMIPPTPEPPRVRVGCLGDSITEGGYPQDLRELLGPGFQVANEGVHGETTSQMLGRWRYGLRQARLSHLVILGGVNDLREGSGSADVVIGNLRTLFDEARGRSGLRLWVATLLPFKGDPAWSHDLEVERRRVNEWILEYCSTHREVSCIDAGTATDDGGGALRPEFDSGDHLHLSAAGTQRLAELVRDALHPT